MAAPVEDTTIGQRKRDLARRVVDLTRREVLASSYFLAPALGRLEVSWRPLGAPFATDGRELYVDADVLLAEYSRTRELPVHDLVHVLVHCLLLHPFAGADRTLDQASWSLAADIEAERLTAELCGPRRGARGEALQAVVRSLEGELGRPLGTERIYRALKEGRFATKRAAWARAFAVDDPSPWFGSPQANVRGQGGASEEDDATHRSHEGGGGGHAGAASSLRRAREDAGADREVRGRRREGPSSGQDQQGGRTPHGTGEHRGMREAYDSRSSVGGLEPPDESLAREWRRAARTVRLDLETTSRARGGSLGELTHALRVSGRPPQDLAGFLRQFGVPREVMHASPDEFDYVFYTYGLRLYGNMPLIENLEYAEQHRIRDFVIVIDTSRSVEGPVVQRFVDEAFGVLSAHDTYCDQVNVHVIQCDTKVRSDDRLTSRADLERWEKGLVLRGFGGTDFRPAFDYVDELVRRGEFDELVGLLYFTDGQGVYPTRPPSYKVAFVFYDEDHGGSAVPPWAMQLVLTRAQLERGEHEH